MNEAHSLPPDQAEAPQPTVLVVEDDVLVRAAVSEHLRECGFEVVEAGNADEAIRIFTAGIGIDLVFSDINMPGGMDGRGLAAWVYGNHPHVKVILTSGIVRTSEPSGERHAYAPILAKPYDYKRLVHRIRETLTR
jgi:CheY-like chemotaxis protein